VNRKILPLFFLIFFLTTCGNNSAEITVCSQKDCSFEFFEPYFVRIFDGLNYNWQKIDSDELKPVPFVDLSEVPLISEGSTVLAKKNDENGLSVVLYKKSGKGSAKIIHKLDNEIQEVISACKTDFNFWTLESAQSEKTGEKLFILSSYDTGLKNKEFYLLLKADKFLAVQSLIRDQILYEEPSAISCSDHDVFVSTILYYANFIQYSVYKFNLAEESIIPVLNFFPLSKGGIAKYYNAATNTLYLHQENKLNIQKGLGFPSYATIKSDSDLLIFKNNGSINFVTAIKEKKKFAKIRIFKEKALDISK